MSQSHRSRSAAHRFVPIVLAAHPRVFLQFLWMINGALCVPVGIDPLSKTMGKSHVSESHGNYPCSSGFNQVLLPICSTYERCSLLTSKLSMAAETSQVWRPTPCPGLGVPHVITKGLAQWSVDHHQKALSPVISWWSFPSFHG